MAAKKPIHDTRDAFDVFLWAADLGVEARVGTMYRDTFRMELPASFAYDSAWLKSGHSFMLDPRLELWPGEQHPEVDMPAFGVFMDSAPDRWGRGLLERREAALAEREGRKMRQLHEVDFLLGVHDLTRMGALRFRKGADGPAKALVDEVRGVLAGWREEAHKYGLSRLEIQRMETVIQV